MAVSSSAQVRSSLDHPVIDADGHTVEFGPAVYDRLREIAGPDIADTASDKLDWYRLSDEERAAHRVARPPWWGILTANTLDRATAMLPKLLYERLDVTGVDYAIVYPTSGMFALREPNAELRQALSRAYNTYHADVFAEFSDRLCPVAVIPMHTPAEALAEIDHAVGELGMKAVTLAGIVERPVPAVQEAAPELDGDAVWIDSLGVDSAHDYDPVWRRCAELKVTPTFHTGGMGWGSRTSTNNYMYNHIGHFAAAGHAACKALFFGGVTRRFPDLRFAFLEGGAGWAANLYNDIVGHWEKRNATAVRNYDPGAIDLGLLEQLFVKYGDRVTAGRADDLEVSLKELTISAESDDRLDEWAAIDIERVEDIQDRFVTPFFFGCEADDAMTATAFDTDRNALGARLQAVFSSDMGHWDVPDISEVLSEAYELVDHGHITTDDFRDFTFTNVTHLFGDVNPSFFDNTSVADACRRELG